MARTIEDLPYIDFDAAWQRLQRLTLEQRADVAETLRRLGMAMGPD